MTEWLDYKGSNSLAKGVYRWNVGRYTFIAECRARGAGFETVTSPSFDHWDGYRVLVPKNLRYQTVDEDTAMLLGREKYACIEVSGLPDIEPCPFCKSVPKIEFSGQWIGAPPWNAERYRLECCGFINSHVFGRLKVDDVVQLWNERLQK